MQQLAGHAQVDDEHRVVVERQQQELAAPAGAGEARGRTRRPASSAGDWRRTVRRPSTRTEVDRATDDGGLEAAADRLDLGKLGHLGVRAWSPRRDGHDLERGGGRHALGDLLRGTGAPAEDLAADGHLGEEDLGVVRALVGHLVGREASGSSWAASSCSRFFGSPSLPSRDGRDRVLEQADHEAGRGREPEER